jgi:predicted RNA-binding protein with PUA-like domain
MPPSATRPRASLKDETQPEVSLASAAAPWHAKGMPSRPAPPQHWLVKSEPETYSWSDFQRERSTAWTGVRNYSARLNLLAMRAGDHVLFYESVSTKAVIGTARVAQTAFPDATAPGENWVAVQLEAGEPLAVPVTLARIKAEPALKEMALLRLSRLSVQPVTATEYARVLRLGAG